MAGVIAMLGWAALVLQLYLIVELRLEQGASVLGGIVNYLSYFTILTNLLVAAATTAIAWFPSVKFFKRPAVQAGIALYISVVGITYSLLLRHIWNPQGAQKVADVLLHDVIPALYTGYWIFKAPKVALPSSQALRWLGYPLSYCMYALVRGAATGVYPYPFIDAGRLGYPAVLANAAFLTVSCWLLGLGLIRVSHWLTSDTAAGSSCCD